MSVGYDHVDVAALRKRNIPLGNTPCVLTETTAELALALLLATARRLPEGTHAVQSGGWASWKPMWLTGRDIHDSTVGLVGLGRIGAAFARRLGGFGCRILYTGPREKPEAARAVGATFAPMDTLLQESDFVAVHCPLNDQTRALFSTDAFRKMKSTAVFINTSRGGVVDQDALYQALAQGEIAAAGLDVTDPEPLPADSSAGLPGKLCHSAPHRQRHHRHPHQDGGDDDGESARRCGGPTAAESGRFVVTAWFGKILAATGVDEKGLHNFARTVSSYLMISGCGRDTCGPSRAFATELKRQARRLRSQEGLSLNE